MIIVGYKGVVSAVNPLNKDKILLLSTRICGNFTTDKSVKISNIKIWMDWELTLKTSEPAEHNSIHLG